MPSFKKNIRNLIFCLPTFILALTVTAQVTVRKSAGQYRNPSAVFSGISGNSSLSAAVASDLEKCGWFDMQKGGNAEISISGAASGSALTMRVTGTQNFSVSQSIIPGSPADTSHRAVDKILKKLFNIPGICSSEIAFCAEPKRGYKEIYICDFDGKNVKRITRNNSLSVEPDWTPGGKSIVYTMYKYDCTDIVETELKSQRSRRLAQFKGLNAGGAVSPNGKYLAMILSRDGSVDLYIRVIGSRGIKRLTKGKSVEASPCWSPGGEKICYVSDKAGRPQLYIINANGGSSIKLSSIGSEAVSPDWSAANKIVYSAKMGPGYTVALIDLKSGESKNLVHAAGDWESPSWAPDNRHIVCSRKISGKFSLYIIDSWTGKVRHFLGGKSNLSMPSWSGITN